MHQREFFSRHTFLPILYFFFFFFSFVCLLFFFLPFFFFIFCTLSRKWRPALFVLTLRHLFLQSYGHSVTVSAKLLNKCERYKWTGVQKWMAVFFWFKCVRNVIEKAVSTCVIILQDRKVKKIQLHNFKVSSTTVWRYMTNKGWKAVNRKRRRICRHGAEGFGKFIAQDDRSANSRDVNPLETI